MNFPAPLPASSALAQEFAKLDAALGRTPRPDAVFDRSACPPHVLSRLVTQWRQRQGLEHRSSMVFTQLGVQLFEANAAPELTAVMLRMAQDELRHARRCEVVRAALGDSSPLAADPTVLPLARHEGTSPRERALRNVLYTTCCSELVACARFVATLDVLKDAFLAEHVRALLADEVLHGQFGFHYLVLEADWLRESPAAVASTNRFLTHAFHVLEQELGMPGDWPAVGPEERAWGLEDAETARALFFETIEAAVLPGLDAAGLDATGAWRRRGHLPG